MTKRWHRKNLHCQLQSFMDLLLLVPHSRDGTQWVENRLLKEQTLGAHRTVSPTFQIPRFVLLSHGFRLRDNMHFTRTLDIQLLISRTFDG
jgi:hypothetical protein